MAATARPGLRVAVWQCRPHPLDVAGNVERLADATRRAAGDGADVLVAPEMFTTGYDIGAAATAELAEPAGGRTERALAALTRDTGVALAVGVAERGPGGALFNTALLLDGGAVVARHHKLHLFGDVDRSRFAAGALPPPVVALRGHPVAIMICYDVEFPESVRSAALRGARTVLVPTANMRGYEIVSTTLVPARAYENGVHVAYANYCGAEHGTAYAGRSTVCAPDGAALLLADDRTESLHTVELRPAAGAPSYLDDLRDDVLCARPDRDDPGPRHGPA